MKQYSADFLSTLQTLPKSCVYAVISDPDMKVIVSHSNDLKGRIGAILEVFKYSEPRLLILQNMDDLEGKLLLCEMYKHELAVAGYSIVNVRPYINYKVSIQYDRHMQRVLVVLYNIRRDKTIVGQFKTMDDAKSFVSTYYINKDVVVPVYAIGENRYIN